MEDILFLQTVQKLLLSIETEQTVYKIHPLGGCLATDKADLQFHPHGNPLEI